MALTLVSTVTVGSGGASSIEWTGIAQTGKDLLVKLSARNSSSGALSLRLNSDGGDNYEYLRLRGNGSTVSTFSSIPFSTDGIDFYGAVETAYTANTFANTDITIANYAVSQHKSVSVDSVSENNGTLAFQEILGGLWRNNAGVTTVTIRLGTFVEFTTASLYIIS
jgi:hypothetical protein